jgi:hypothetical protein
MPKLRIIGDSFSWIADDDANSRQWPLQLVNKLSYELDNRSMIGCSQDYTWYWLHQERTNISPDDQLVIVMTSPNRYWLFEDRPDLTNPATLSLFTDPKYANIAETYFKHIQRPDMDYMAVKNRLGWLNNAATVNNWKPPLIIFAFAQSYGLDSEYPRLKFSKGSLTEDVSNAEQADPFVAQLFRGRDPRYNHLCLCNHDILAEKIYKSLIEETTLDLTQGFYKGMLDNNTLRSDMLVKNELSPRLYKEYLNTFENSKWEKFIKTMDKGFFNDE